MEAVPAAVAVAVPSPSPALEVAEDDEWAVPFTAVGLEEEEEEAVTASDLEDTAQVLEEVLGQPLPHFGLLPREYVVALLCFALLCFALLCFALLCFALLCFALLCFVLL